MSSKKKNILGTDLIECNSINNLYDSSINGFCNEPGNGYHNICIKMDPFVSKNFSQLTGQSDWSESKKGNNHCICQGAWANYIAKLKEKGLYKELPNNILNCEAIPEEVLTDHKHAFKTWNNITKKEQDTHGIQEIIKQCNLKI